jgi:hypothetical protein
MKSQKIVFEVRVEDFAETFSRTPRGKKEFSEFREYCEKGLRNGHIDWNIVLDCAKDAMKK